MVERLDKDDRKRRILEAATSVALASGSYTMIRRHDVAIQAGVTRTLITHYFGSIEALKDEIVRAGIDNDNTRIIAQAILNSHHLVNDMSKADKLKVLRKIC